MPATRAPRKKAAPPARKRPALNQPQLIEEPDEIEPGRPTMYEGVAVEREVPIEHIKGKPFRISRLFLANDTVAFACRDCEFTAATRGPVMAHRNAEHGARIGKNRLPAPAPLKEAPDLIAPPRPDGSRPASALELTIGEIVAMAPTFAALGDLIEQTERERDAALAELVDRRQFDRSNQHKIDVYESHRSELIELRLQVQKQGNYEAVKDELYALRAWKRKITQRLSAVGFQFTEEDQ